MMSHPIHRFLNLLILLVFLTGCAVAGAPAPTGPEPVVLLHQWADFITWSFLCDFEIFVIL